jgi:hypothetical protein
MVMNFYSLLKDALENGYKVPSVLSTVLYEVYTSYQCSIRGTDPALNHFPNCEKCIYCLIEKLISEGVLDYDSIPPDEIPQGFINQMLKGYDNLLGDLKKVKK